MIERGELAFPRCSAATSGALDARPRPVDLIDPRREMLTTRNYLPPKEPNTVHIVSLTPHLIRLAAAVKETTRVNKALDTSSVTFLLELKTIPTYRLEIQGNS